jgi:hypothetical protein
MLGMHHYRYEAAMGTTSEKGTSVSVNEIKNIVERAIFDVTTRPTCLHDTKNTLQPVFSGITLS